MPGFKTGQSGPGNLAAIKGEVTEDRFRRRRRARGWRRSGTGQVQRGAVAL